MGEGLVAFDAGISLGGQRGEDLLEADPGEHRGEGRGGVGRQVLGGKPPAQARVAFKDSLADLLGVASRGQVGAREEHLAAAGGKRHEAAQGKGVTDRPGGDDEDGTGEEDRGLGERPAPFPLRGAGEDDQHD